MSADCYRTVDNKYMSCPPRMSDGRHFTEYRPSSELDDAMRFENSLNNSYFYRQFLVANAGRLMDSNREAATTNMMVYPCPSLADPSVVKQPNKGPGTMLPEQSMWISDGRMMRMQTVNSDGLGAGRAYWTQQPGPAAYWPLAPRESNNCTTPFDKMFQMGDVTNFDTQTGRIPAPYQ
jgi:hypothetical protein